MGLLFFLPVIILKFNGAKSTILACKDSFEVKWSVVLAAAMTYHNERFNIGLNVYNITNTNYATFGYFNSSTNEWRYTPGEPVNFRLSFGGEPGAG